MVLIRSLNKLAVCLPAPSPFFARASKLFGGGVCGVGIVDSGATGVMSCKITVTYGYGMPYISSPGPEESWSIQ